MKEKLSLYEYLNFVLIGLIFTGCCVLVFKDDELIKTIFKEIKTLSLGIEVVITFILFGLIYEIGFIINRLGSILIEPIFKKLKIIHFNNDYKLFNERKKEYPIMEVLSREFALSRTQISLFFILMVISLLNKQFIIAVVFFLFVILFTLSMRKHSKKIVDFMS
ncbi:MAG: hypothetical protein K2H13_09480 [Eubacterium sp.]|nr:hypothetical protein [Eubacterium sp.]